MLHPFKHKGHNVVMDSAYMSDAMCQVGREEWKINMVGTVKTDQCGAGPLGKAACKAKVIEIHTHESLIYQHNTKPLCYAVWGDNNFVKTLSNFHSPVIMTGGIKRKKRNLITKRREREFSDDDCPVQQKSYCNTYHKIDKGNGAEAKYDLSTESHLHGWGPKLAARLFNMNTNNAYKLYCSLYKKHHPERKPMELKDCINNLTHSLLQQGDDMRQRLPGCPPSASKDLTSTVSGDGRATRADAKNQPFTPVAGPNGTGAVHAGTTTTPGSALTARGLHYQEVAFNKRQRDYVSRVHQPMPMLVRGEGEKSGSGARCDYKKCPGLNIKSKRIVSYKTIYQCEQCTVEKKRPIFLCHTTKKINGKPTVVSCHLKYHAEKEFLKTISTTECSSVSDLTEEGTDPPNNNIDSV
jgi:hypothetical protein